MRQRFDRSNVFLFVNAARKCSLIVWSSDGVLNILRRPNSLNSKQLFLSRWIFDLNSCEIDVASFFASLSRNFMQNYTWIMQFKLCQNEILWYSHTLKALANIRLILSIWLGRKSPNEPPLITTPIVLVKINNVRWVPQNRCLRLIGAKCVIKIAKTSSAIPP